MQYWPGSDLDGLVRFWPNASGPKACQCARITGSGSGRMPPACYHYTSFPISDSVVFFHRCHQPATTIPVSQYQTQLCSSTDATSLLPLYQFPNIRLSCVLPQMTQIILCKTSLDPVWFWLTVSGLGQMDLVCKQATVTVHKSSAASAQHFQADLDQM